jgi:hypothetical protein
MTMYDAYVTTYKKHAWWLHYGTDRNQYQVSKFTVVKVRT